MATLSQSTKRTRQFFVGCLIFVIVAILCSCFGSWAINQLNTTTAISEVEDRAFGELPILDLSNLAIKANLDNAIFSIETPSGRAYITRPNELSEFPNSMNVANVYQYIAPRQTLTSFDDTISQAKAVGFSGEFSQNGSLLTLQNATKILKIDTIQKSINITSDITKDKTYDTLKPFVGDAANYSTAFRNQLVSNGALNSNFSDAWSTSEYLKYDSELKTYITESSPLKAELVRISFFKNFQVNTIQIPQNGTDIEKATAQAKQYFGKVYNESPRFSNTQLIAGSSVSNDGIYFFNSDNWYASKILVGKYNIYSIQEAVSKLQQKQAVLVDLKRANRTDDYDLANANEVIDKIYVKRIELGYFESKNFQNYMQPIYIFNGAATLKNSNDTETQAEFTFYLPAIKR